MKKLFIIPALILGQFSTLVLADSKIPKLILQITVDQLRGDLPMRYYNRLGKGGFRYLWQKGIVYSDAHHAHANTETIVGHTTLATGTHPSVHGMVGNLWFDRDAGHTVYNIEDANYQLLTHGGDVDGSTEIDPTQKAAISEGRSPSAILVTTFADELKANSGGRSKTFSVSVKDRGAVPMAGHGGKAFWFSKANGEFVTSNHYYDKYPQWVTDWNKQKPVQQYAETNWQLLNAQDEYAFADSDDRPWEVDLAGFGRTFPHSYGKGDGKYFTTMLTISPAGDALTLDFAKTLLQAEQLGKDEYTDYLAISFSSTDYVGHIFGPSSLEAEDNILQLDRRLAELFAFIDKEVGLENTLIVLSADHGGPDTPGYLQQQKIPSGYVNPDSWDKDAAISRIKKQFNIKGKLLDKYEHPYLYLNAVVVNDKNIDLEKLELEIIKELSVFEGVSQAISSTALQKGNLPDTHITRAVQNNFNTKRSGDIYIVFKPNWFINDFDGLSVAASHGSPWNYDTYVPIVFAGAGIKAKQVTRRVLTVDIAPTLSNFVNIKAPSGAVGKVLDEVAKYKADN